MMEISGLVSGYGRIGVLHGIDLTVGEGSCVGILGHNGMGKTTLLRTIMGLLPTKAGRIGFNGAEIQRLPTHARARLGIGYVPQGREIFGRLTVRENLLMGLATRPGSTPLPDALFELFPVLHTMLNRRGGDLSGGQQQQLAIGRALAAGPRLLILDEPTEGIQPSIIKDIGRVLRRLATQGLDGAPMAIVLVEQYYDFAAELADQYLVMERGAIVQRGAGRQMDADGVRARMSI
jgi:urea transport system ATP-binding protein